MKSKIIEMFKIQDELNTIAIGNTWRESNCEFYRAAIVETCELMEYVGYKWWKAAPKYDVDQAHLEIVDIWHFVMSDMMQVGVVNYTAFNETFTHLKIKSNVSKEEKLSCLDNFIEDASMFLGTLDSFVNIMSCFNLTFDQLYNLYIGKFTLNKFRYANGYKKGTYVKNGWVAKDGLKVEDNVILSEILTHESETNKIYSELERRYREIK